MFNIQVNSCVGWVSISEHDSILNAAVEAESIFRSGVSTVRIVNRHGKMIWLQSRKVAV